MGRENSEALDKAVRYVILCLLMLAGCKKDKPFTPGDKTPPIYTNARNVYVACEGNFGNGNASLSLYRPVADSVYDDIYQMVNGQPLGDVLQSMMHIENRIFLCVNNSDKVEVIDRYNWKNLGTINIPKPRYIVAVSPTKAYVSSLYTNQVTIINPRTLEITGHVTMPGNNPEGMLYHKEQLYVTLWDTAVNKLYSIDPITDQVSVVQTLAGNAPQEVLADREGMLWVLSGNVHKGKKAALTRIDPTTKQILQSYNFPATADPLRLVLDNTGNRLYFIEVNYSGGTAHNGIYRLGINDVALPSQPLVQAQELQYFWALGIEPETGNIYVGDPKGFTQRGTVYIYNENGSFQKSFNCGVGPGHFYFDK